MTCYHVESTDPRRRGICYRCGRKIPPPKPPARDHDLEAELIDTAIDLVTAADGTPWPIYARRVNDRLALGARTYGDDDFLGKDNLIEAAQESPDLGAYAVLELQRLKRKITDAQWEELRMSGIALIAAGVRADLAAHRFLTLRRDLLGEDA